MKRMLDKVLEMNSCIKRNETALSFDVDKIEFEVDGTGLYQGAFHITTEDSAKPEGYVYSSDLRMTVRTPEFGGLNKEIIFVFDGTGLKEGSEVGGRLHIVSNLGECNIEYVARIGSSNLNCRLGEVKNLFHFANLAMTDWNEAVNLFYDSSFVNIFTENDKEYLEYYKGLSKCLPDENGDYTIGNESNVDRFLEIARKKTRISYTAGTSYIELKNPTESLTKNIAVKKEGWGYVCLNVETEGDFIEVQKDYLDIDDFEDNICELPVYIKTEALYRGVNHGKVIIYDFFSRIEINIKVTNGIISSKEKRYRLRDICSLFSIYMDYRVGAVNKQEWVKNSLVAVSKMLSETPDDIEACLYHVHCLYVEKREKESFDLLMLTRSYFDENTSDTLVGYAYYLEYLLTGDEIGKAELAEKLEYLFVRNNTNFRLAWFMLYTDEELIKSDKNRLRFIKNQYDNGCNSPLMYIEALECMIRNPGLFMEMGEFELSITAFAIRHKAMTKELRNRFVFMAGNLNVYSDEVFHILEYCYENDSNEETLTVMCQMLMKGNRIGQDCFKWYELAVENEIRISRLYEYYMMSIDLSYKGRLPKIVLMYFAYRSNLDYERNAFLYSNVLRHRPAYNDIYEDYLGIIEQFAIEQIALRRIDDNLAYIYKTVLGDRLYTEEFVEDYAALLFSYIVYVERDDISRIIVVDEHLVNERSYPVYNRQSRIELTEHEKCILLEDIYGNRYADKTMYQISRIIRFEGKLEQVMKMAGLSLLPALYLSEKADEQSSINEENENALLYLSECPEVTEDYRNSIMMNLAEYYFDRDEIAKLDELMLRFNPDSIDPNMREKNIRILVARGMYDRALDWVETYGTEYVDDRVLVRLCDRVLVRCDYEYDPDILKICEGIFRKGKYDETILQYLILYKQGALQSLKSLWRASDSFNMDVHNLLENMVVQILYSGAHVGEEGNIYLEYVNGGANPKLEMLLLDLLSYRYFVKDEQVCDAAFDRCVYLHQNSEELSDYIKLAFLKRCRKLNAENKLDEEQKTIVVLFLKEFSNRHIIFPFFMEFKNLWSKLLLYEDRCFIEYRGQEDSKVYLHYVYEHGDSRNDEYKKQEMTHLIGGIFVRSFVLFYGERIRYYITEEGTRSEKLTKASVLELSDAVSNDGNRRFSIINNIAISREMNDDRTLRRLSEEYIKKAYLTDNLFSGV